jgi:DNA-binding SARP family transcriptional activator
MAQTQHPQRLEIRVLGEPGVWLRGTPVRWRAHSARDLLFYLLSYPEGRHRESVLASLWGLEPSPASFRRFRLTLHRLRAALERPQAVRLERERLLLHQDILKASDLGQFYLALGEAEHAATSPERISAYRKARAAYQGEFLEGEQAEWVLELRLLHQHSYTQAVVELALELCMTSPEASSCDRMVEALIDALRADPFLGEDYHQWLMRCLVQAESKYAALEHYRRFIAFLREHLSEWPTRETRELAERIRAGEGVLCQPPTRAPHGFSCPLTLERDCKRWRNLA